MIQQKPMALICILSVILIPVKSVFGNEEKSQHLEFPGGKFGRNFGKLIFSFFCFKNLIKNFIFTILRFEFASISQKN
jgi:hypothetical protein